MLRKMFSRPMFVLVVVGISIAIVGSGCVPAPAPTPAPTAAARLVIGVGSAHTGPTEAAGRIFDTCQKIYQGQANAEGGLLVAGERYMVDLIIEDTKLEAAESLTVGEKLIYGDKVRFITTLGTPAGITMEGMARREKVIIMESSGSGVGVSPEHTYYFDVLWSRDGAAPGVFEAIRERHPDLTRVLRVTVDAPWDHGFSSGEQKALAEMEWAEWVGEPTYELGTIDLMPTVTAALAAEPDLIILGWAGNTPVVLTTLRDMGYDGVVYVADPAWGPYDLEEKMAPKEHYLNNVYFALPLVYPYHPEVLELIEEYEAFGVEWADVAMERMWGIVLLLEGIKAAGTIDDTDAVTAAITALNVKAIGFDPPYDRLYFSGQETKGINHMIAQAVGITTWEDGVAVTIATIMAELP